MGSLRFAIRNETRGVVVHSTMRLNGLRKRLEIERPMLNFRDLWVMRDPQKFDPEEVRLVRQNWLACLVLFALVMALIALSPDDLVQRLGSPRPPS